MVTNHIPKNDGVSTEQLEHIHSLVTGLRVATDKPCLVSTVAYHILELDLTHRSYHLMPPRRQSINSVYKSCQINWGKVNDSLTIPL
jgi:hypothetical protein